MPAKDWKRFEGDDTYVKFNAFGDYVEGVINQIKFETKFGKDVPVLYLRCAAVDEETGRTYQKERVLTVGQKNLQRQLAQNPPEEGDGILITYIRDEPGSPNPTKIFEVKVTPRSMMGQQQAPQGPAPADSGDDPF